MTIEIVFKLLGALALLIYGMKLMSEALQKMAGPQLRHILGAMTANAAAFGAKTSRSTFPKKSKKTSTPCATT